VIEIRGPQSFSRRFSLFAGNDAPVVQRYSDRDYYFSLRLKRIFLPLRLKLLHFEKTLYQGSEIPKSFASRVEIESDGLHREALISMNRPLRFRGYTFYQSSYGEDARHGASSTFAVVKNAGRWLPYISSALIFLGLALHFLSQLVAALKKSRSEVKA
jgi:cytochrome c biogenesis protein ResB